jgi:hypothetical protein
LLGVHSLYGLHIRAVTVFRDTLIRRLQPLRLLHDAPVASGWSGCRVGLAPTGKTPPYHGARQGSNRTLKRQKYTVEAASGSFN